MTKKELEIKLSNLVSEVNELKGKLEENDKVKVLTIEHARQRDYLVRKDFYGRITDPRIKLDFKKEVETKFKMDFKNIMHNFTNFNFYDENKKCIIDEFSDLLQKYEYKQIILDTYPIKKDK